MRVGLIGVGLMGRGMGHRLIKAGHALAVLGHQRRETIDELVGAGAREYESAVALALASDVVVTCLPGVDSVDSVLFGESGAASAPAGRLFLDCSTSLPEASREFAQRLAKRGHRFVDAPLTGGPAEAAGGKLLALVGGAATDVESARSVLEAFCESIHVFGDVGCGQAAKLINNSMGFGILGIVSEAIATALQQKLDMSALLAVISRSGGQSRVLQGLTPWLLEGDMTRLQVSVATACKDVAYYMRLARSCGTDGPVFEAVLTELRHAIDSGLGPELLTVYPASIAARNKTKLVVSTPER